MGCSCDARERFSVSFWSEGRGKPHNRQPLEIATGRPPLKPASGHCQQSRAALRIERDNSRTPKRFQAFYVRSAVVLIWGIGLKKDKSAGFGYFDLIRRLSCLSPRVRGNCFDLEERTWLSDLDPVVSYTLQCIQDLSAMDTRLDGRVLQRNAKLQWSHDLSAMDTRAVP